MTVRSVRPPDRDACSHAAILGPIGTHASVCPWYASTGQDTRWNTGPGAKSMSSQLPGAGNWRGT